MNTLDRDLLLQELRETNDFTQRQQLLKLLWHLEQQLQPHDESACRLAPLPRKRPIHRPTLSARCSA
jgi:hypothetical protein